MNAPTLAPLRSILVALSLAVLAAAAVATVRPAAAQGDPRVEARTRYMAGKAKFDAADYRGAIGEFTAADQLAPSAMNDYNIALAYERLGEPASAVRYYRSYLNRQPTAANRAEVEAALARLDAAAKDVDRISTEDAVKAEAARREEARKADEARKAEEMRRLAEQGGGTGQVVGVAPTSYGATGDAELDRVAAVDLSAMRGAAPLPPPRNAGAAGGAAGAAGAGGAGDVPPKKNKSIFKNPVFWVVVGVGLYAVIVLSDDSSSSGNGLMAPLPMGPSPGPAGNGVLMRF